MKRIPKNRRNSQQKEGAFLLLPHKIINHPEFLIMNWASQALLIHIGSFHNGSNNGDISIPHSIMKLRGWSKGSLADAKNELLEYDWIRLTRQGGKTKIPSLYALSWKPIDADVKPCKLDINVSSYRLRKL